VALCVLLNMTLYFGNILLKYFVDFVAISLVSWRAISASVFCCINLCNHGRVVLSNATFYVANCVS
jgi:hypothetical protein